MFCDLNGTHLEVSILPENISDLTSPFCEGSLGFVKWVSPILGVALLIISPNAFMGNFYFFQQNGIGIVFMTVSIESIHRPLPILFVTSVRSVDSTLLCYVLILPSPETQSNQANSTRSMHWIF
eukprot:sb/3475753/